MKSIIGLGNAITDIFISLPDNLVLERFNLSPGSVNHVDDAAVREILAAVEGVERVEVPGGSAANTVAAASYLGMRGAFVGKVGSDSIGENYIKDLDGNGVVPHILTGKGGSGVSLVLDVAGGAEKTIVTSPGAALELSEDEICNELFKGYDYLHLEGYLFRCPRVVEKAMAIARKEGMTISFDLGNSRIVENNLQLVHSLVREHVDILFANEDEARALTGLEGAEAAMELSGRGCGMTAVVKMGEKGSVVCRGGELFKVAAESVEVADTVGAGDAYAAGFLFAHSLGFPLYECGCAGAMTAAGAVGTVGPKIGKSGLEAIKTKICHFLEIKD